ncbi:MAG: type II toxin-antitoxin system RelE/ParE family toxin [Phycisphaerae bacterium]|nr:type II toxin-antitoxin system RelE/ParE family toxin [Phycisphaerae bacterium]NIP52379.1 type II toxin-antitoxin system RelE/ParE family toxin [Phycisphaerae bacterium]NIS51375.1 type II toxin-antitoxin system RelE/ParE family toxin [Phycisphaerae bacterium]NIU08990.1 type II toxin-antitoxin system RelE/ParE family toxin [Phycisphaerae bacterium]NIU56650.1 type II toxin-antitoxin system RelE/ParE family toxin [Phycisphaerae bacterium]
MYKIIVAESAADFIRGQAKKIQRQLYNKIKNLGNNPYPPNCVKLKGQEDLYRIRSGDYRIIYMVKSKEVIILVLRIAHRRQVYRKPL